MWELLFLCLGVEKEPKVDPTWYLNKIMSSLMLASDRLCRALSKNE